jgi:hypothetical protein
MKNKLFFPLLAVSVILMSCTACTRSLTVQSAPTDIAQTDKGAGDPLHINEVNAKVLRSFHDSYGELPGVNWFNAEKGFLATFKHDGIKKNIYYNLKGAVESEIFYYTEDRMSPEMRHFVKSRFYDFGITHVTEVHKKGATAYYVKLEDRQVVQTVKIVGEEWEVVESLVKK